MGRLFGTDGVRGIANTELTPELAFSLGRTGASVLAAKSAGRPRIVVGRDTRVSGRMLEAALAAGMASTGADVLLLGVVPTPGVAYLARSLGADAGAVISASHNPVDDNGIKFFAGDGFKLPDEVEDEIEALIDRADAHPRPAGMGVGRIWDADAEVARYARHAASTCSRRLDGLKVVVDCANGAASGIAPQVYRSLGAKVFAMADAPDGGNINAGCGSTHPEALQAEVVRVGADMGIAHDGDCDRTLAVDGNGALVDGDQIMAICGKLLIKEGKLPSRTIVATPYSNLGLTRAFEAAGGGVVVAKNGDRYVLEEMRRRGLTLGGEQSGHIIFLEHNTTGDGIITALQLMAAVSAGPSLSRLAAEAMDRFPQVLVNVRVASKAGLKENEAIYRATEQAEAELAGRGRVFVRASGTEPLVRVMVEGPDEGECRAIANALAEVVSAELG